MNLNKFLCVLFSFCMPSIYHRKFSYISMAESRRDTVAHEDRAWVTACLRKTTTTCDTNNACSHASFTNLSLDERENFFSLLLFDWPLSLSMVCLACIAPALAWLASSENQMSFTRQQVSDDDGDGWAVTCPSLGGRLVIQLEPPHTLLADGHVAVLRELESAFYTRFYDDSVPPSSSSSSSSSSKAAAAKPTKHATLVDLLAFAHAFLSKRRDTVIKSHDKEEGDDDDADFQVAGSDEEADWGDMEDVGADIVELTPAIVVASPDFTSYTRTALLTQQDTLIEAVAEQLGVTTSAAVCLLRASRWNKSKCVARWKTERDAFVKQACCAGLLHATDQDADAATVTCQVCYDDVPAASSFAMSCGHRFCVGCWHSYLASELEGGTIAGGTVLDTRCMGFKCGQVLGRACVEWLLHQPGGGGGDADCIAAHRRLWERYQTVLALSFVDESDERRWCTAPGCDLSVMRSATAQSHMARCSQGHIFCFTCPLAAHAPCSCEMATEWMARDKGSNLDTKYLLEQTRACPTCGVRTARDGSERERERGGCTVTVRENLLSDLSNNHNQTHAHSLRLCVCC
jgi:hypothetical protein